MDYNLIILDDWTSKSAVYFLWQKSELLSALQKYNSLVENESKGKRSMISVRLDNAGEQTINLVTEYVPKNMILN